MKDEEFEKYFRDITNCMYDCTITKAERRTQMRKILEEIENNARRTQMRKILEEFENNAKGEVLHQVFDKEAEL